MKKFLHWSGIIISFFIMLNEITPVLVKWWDDVKAKRKEFKDAQDASENPASSTVNADGTVEMEQQADGTFVTKPLRNF